MLVYPYHCRNQLEVANMLLSYIFFVPNVNKLTLVWNDIQRFPTLPPNSTPSYFRGHISNCLNWKWLWHDIVSLPLWYSTPFDIPWAHWLVSRNWKKWFAFHQCVYSNGVLYLMGLFDFFYTITRISFFSWLRMFLSTLLPRLP